SFRRAEKERTMLRFRTYRLLVLATVSTILATSHAGALTVTDLSVGLTPIDLVNRLLGPGIVVSNVTYHGASSAAGAFTDGFDAVGFGSGIVLSSGRTRAAEGPNSSDGTSTINGTVGDADLNAQIPGFATSDAAVLEFDIVPASDRLT